MTFNPRHLYLPLAITLALAAGCGNYSNDDLEFMNALPDHGDLNADLPARSALTAGDEAELSKQTHEATRGFNKMLFDILGGVDFIRTFPPSARGHNRRTWGPWPNDEHPDWHWQFDMERDDADSTTFRYRLQLQHDGTTTWVPFLTGQFTSTHGARRGVGSFTMQTDDLRSAGFPLELGEGLKIKSITVEYDTRDFPFYVKMTLVTYPDPMDLTMTVTTSVEYGVQADGRGALHFTITGDLDLSTAAIETLDVKTSWLHTGEGRADATITLGDGVGLSQSQCWDKDFNSTYSHKDWDPMNTSGDPSLCPEISTL